MAVVTLGSKTEGSIVKLNESGSPVEFYVAKQNYESGLNGTGRTLLVRKDCYDNRAWDAGNVNAYASSDIDAWFNSTYKNLLDPDIQEAIGTTKFYYTPGNGNNTVGTLERSIFALSLTELGGSHSNANVEGATLPIASTLKIAYLNGRANTQWTRSIYMNNTNTAWFMDSGGKSGNNGCTVSYGSRPILTLPATALAEDDGTIILNQPPTAPGSITVPTLAAGAQAAITWTAATDPDGTIASYTLERSINGSGWVQIFSGNALTYTDTVGDWGTVAYRVCAVDNYGVSGDYATSETVIVQDGVFYISGPAPDMGEQTVPFDFTITIGISGDAQTVSGVTCTILLDGYSIHTDYTSTGEDTTVNIDVRAISGGTHTITAKADKAGYVSAVQQYTFTTPAIPFPDGGQAEQLQNQGGTPIFPQTTAALVQGLKGESIAGNIEELYNVKANDVRSYPVREGESINAGDVVNVDGDVYRDVIAQANVKQYVGVQIAGTSVIKLSDEYSVCAFIGSDSSKTLYAYLVNNLTGKFIVINISVSTGVSSVSLARLDDTHFVVAYSISGNTTSFANIGTVTGTTIAFGPQAGAGKSGSFSIVPISSDTFFVFSGGSDVNYMNVTYCMVSNSTITLRNANNLQNVKPSYISTTILPDDSNGNKRVCICFADTGDGNKGKAVIATISGSNTVTFGEAVTFIDTKVNYIDCASINNDIVVAYYDGNGIYAMAITLDESGLHVGNNKNYISAGNSCTVSSTNSLFLIVAAYRGTAETGKVVDRELVLSGTYESNGTNEFSFNISSAAISDKKFLLSYADGSNSSYGTTTILEVSGNQIAGSFIDNSKDAIALESGEGGEIIKLGFGGYCECKGVTAGEQITSDGVTAYSPLDGWLEIKDLWTRGYVAGEYTGTGTYGFENPTVIDVGFKPIMVAVYPKGQTHSMLLYKDNGFGVVNIMSTTVVNTVIFTDTGVYFYFNSGDIEDSKKPNAQMNQAGITYYYIAFR